MSAGFWVFVVLTICKVTGHFDHSWWRVASPLLVELLIDIWLLKRILRLWNDIDREFRRNYKKWGK